MNDRQQTVHRYLDGLRRSDHVAVLALLTEDVVWHIHGIRTTRGKAEFDSEIENPAYEGSPVLDMERTIEACDVVVVTGVGQGHHRAAGGFRFAYNDLFTFRGDLIAQVDSYIVPLDSPTVWATRTSTADLPTGQRRERLHMDEKIRPSQLRLIVEVPDFEAALHFYRDLLGMPEQPAFATQGEDRVAILHAGVATIEIATPVHLRQVDTIEGAPRTNGPTARLALEVQDTQAAVTATEGGGMRTLAQPRHTPFRTINARVEGPAGWQVTFFQELETLEERSQREGFTTDEQRPR